MQDDVLINMLRTDPERGMKKLMDTYAGLVYTVVRNKLTASIFCPADIESCAADTFAEFYCDLDKYSPALGSIKSWLCVIAKHNAADHLRRFYKEATILSSDSDEAAQYADDFSLEGDFEDRQLRAALINAVKGLGEPDREIMVRKYYLGQSSKEIGKVLGMSVSNVNTRTSRAVRKLKEQFGGD